jgi:hypothetical protein
MLSTLAALTPFPFEARAATGLLSGHGSATGTAHQLVAAMRWEVQSNVFCFSLRSKHSIFVLRFSTSGIRSSFSIQAEID